MDHQYNFYLMASDPFGVVSPFAEDIEKLPLTRSAGTRA